jgi:integrase
LWEEYQARRAGLKGLITDKNRYDNHLRPDFGGKEPQELIPLDLDRLRLRLIKTHKTGTVRNVLELLRRLVNFAAKKHLCPVPSYIIEMPRVNNLKTEDLNPEQLATLLEAHPRPAALTFSPDAEAAGAPTSISRWPALKRQRAYPGPSGRCTACARLCLHAGLFRPGGPLTLQKLLTHKSAAMTQRYAHLRDDALRRASDLAGYLLGQVEKGEAAQNLEILCRPREKRFVIVRIYHLQTIYH